MTCRQLGGACDIEFRAQTFEQMAELSRNHGMKMFQEHDGAHIRAMEEMMEMTKNPDQMKNWHESRKKEFDSLPDELS